MGEDGKSFEYTYCAKEQEEIKRIRQQYAGSQESIPDKLEQLRRLDASVTKKGTAAALVVGIIGALILGVGMSLVMSDFGKVLGVYSHLSMLIGVIIGLVGIILICLAYPIYDHITKKERKRIAPEILRLSDELLR